MRPGAASNGVGFASTPIDRALTLLRINLSCRIPARAREAGGATRPTSAVFFFTNSFSRNGAAGGSSGRRVGLALALAMAKAPVPGQVKTRMCPPCSHEQAAALAEAALHYTLAAVRAVPDVGHVVVLDGAAGDWLPPGVEVDGAEEAVITRILTGLASA